MKIQTVETDESQGRSALNISISALGLPGRPGPGENPPDATEIYGDAVGS